MLGSAGEGGEEIPGVEGSLGKPGVLSGLHVFKDPELDECKASELRVTVLSLHGISGSAKSQIISTDLDDVVDVLDAPCDLDLDFFFSLTLLSSAPCTNAL